MIRLLNARHPSRHGRRSLRTRIAAALVCAAPAIAACDDATGPRLPSEGAPEDLRFGIGGFGGPSRLLQMRGDTVIVYRVDWDPAAPVDSMKVVPSAEAWRAFWAGADEAGVRLWKREYRQEDIVDGGGYSLRLVVDGRIIESAGSNAYPDRHGREHEGEMTDDFVGFIETISDLIGRPF